MENPSTLREESFAWYLGFCGPSNVSTQWAQFSAMGSPLFSLSYLTGLAFVGNAKRDHGLQPNSEWLSKSYGICRQGEKVTETSG